MIRRLLLLAALALGAATPAHAALAPSELSKAGIAPPPGARLPEGLALTERSGERITLGRSDLPTLLIFADYTCRHICGSALTLTAAALEEAGLKPARDVRLAVIGLDPKDGPAEARAMADRRLSAFPDIANAALLLSGDQATIDRLEQAFGYGAVYEPEADQYAHDTGAFLLTPDGRLSSVLPEIGLSAEDLRRAVAAAASGKTAGPSNIVTRAISLCYGFAAAHGANSAVVVAALRGVALGFVALMGFALWRLARRRPVA
jgi:protein SCO1/2